METKDYLSYIVHEIHTTIVATVDDEGLPVTAAIDMMDSDEKSLYFLKVIDLSKIDVDQLKKEIKTAQYKAVEIEDLKAFIEQALQQMLNRNCTRQKFSQRFRNIIDR